ncbi:MAG: M1 family metallopeptidase [Saprospiraceae bacterium]|nr:M1 family metallopeptidase [Saprospiraceae bacterium]
MRLSLLLLSFLSCTLLYSQENTNTNLFRQLKQELPTPNSYRNASGAPGHAYWQQKADYKISIELKDAERQLHGHETITYTNNSPDVLNYLWMQLDQNVRSKDSDTHKIGNSSLSERASSRQLQRLEPDFDGGFKIEAVKDATGNDLKHVINKTMMRVDPPNPLQPGESFTFQVKWWYNINNTREIGGRSGYENFQPDDNNVYVIAQWFPRMCAYNDLEGWQNKQFLGRGEFTLVFGDYEVDITVPADHLVASTGELMNPKQVLTKAQRDRLEEAAKEHIQPITIASYDEAEERIKTRSTKTKTWTFHAKNVRDFAFASSRRFIWDAMGVPMDDGSTVMAQSMWVKEGDCLWSKYSTKAVAHTVKWYSHYTIDYPYPVAWSIDGSMGMEYPMICFNYGRCASDGTYAERVKYGHIGVIIHEVGHNWFPMIINSDERQWTWMDEGLNTFVQYLTEQHWERNYPSRRGPADKITSYMGGDKSRISPIMTNSESIYQFGANAYAKPATALNILRETIMGRELFDMAFKEYCERWKFKQPYPADLFRTLEDASGVDLDWFWRSWFYTNDHVDIAMTEVKHNKLSTGNPDVEKDLARRNRDDGPRDIGTIRNENIERLADKDPSILDFYSQHDPLTADAIDRQRYQQYMSTLSEEEKAMLKDDQNYYQISFENKGGIPMPIILEFEYEDGSKEVERIPAEIWKLENQKVSKVFVKQKTVKSITLDPFLETADVDRSDNHYPPRPEISRFDLFKQQRAATENGMQRAKRAKAKGS